MIFASPGWLWLLIPWAGVVVILLRKNRVGIGVPFLRFWPEGAITVRHRGIGVPPAWIILMLTAVLAAVVAAARPGPGGVDPTKSAVVVIDRGRSLADGDRYGRAVAEATGKLHQLHVGGRVRIVAVPGPDREVPAEQFESAADALPATGLDVAAELQAAVDRAAVQTGGPLLVVTGSSVKSNSDRAIGVGAGPPGGVAVTLLSVRVDPKPAAMVTLLNRSATAASVRLEITTGKQVITREIQLGPSASESTEFVDLPVPGPVVSARVIQSGDPIDGQRWVARESAAARPDVSATVEPAVQRIARVYAKQHPPTEGSRPVVVGSDVPPDENEPAVVIAPAGPGATGSIRIDDPLLVRDIKSWPAAGLASMPPGFRAVVMENQIPVVAVGTGTARRVWVNLDLAGWSSSPQFVIFFGNVLDFVSGGVTSFGSTNPTRLGPGWKLINGHSPAALGPGLWPGVYESADGQQVAVNADPASEATITVPGGAGSVGDSPSSIGWGRYFVLAALVGVLVALIVSMRWENVLPKQFSRPSDTPAGKPGAKSSG